MGAIRYGRHFCLLAGALPVVAFAHPWGPPGVIFNSGLYGALHAALLALCLRSPGHVARKLTFVVLAACITMCCVCVALQVSRLPSANPSFSNPVLMLILVSGSGATGYFFLIRSLWIARLPLAALAGISIGCMSATLVAFNLTPARAFGGLGMAAAWWFAFSSGLLFYDLRITER